MPPLDVTMFSGPGCMRCRVTANRFDDLGIDYHTEQAAEHPEIVDQVETLGLKRQLPVVRVTGGEHESEMWWTGLDSGSINALSYLVHDNL